MWFLGIDFGTTMSTGACLRDGRLTDVEHSGRNRVPSAVLLDEDGHLVAGDAALNQAAMFPDRIDRTPKESLGGPAPLLLGPEPVEVPRAVAQVLQVLVDEGARAHQGEPPARVALTHPARWSEVRVGALREAASLAGLHEPELVPEPVAAAVQYAEERLDPGALVAVYDFGGGTFDAAVLRRTDAAAGGFEWVGDAGGDEDIGGEDVDYLLYELVGEQLAADDEELWEHLSESDERMWRRANHLLMEEVRKAKESLSTYPTVRIPIPSSDRDVLVTRDELERVIGDEIERTVEAFARTLDSAGVRGDDLSVIYLAGGSSRIPLVSRLMTTRFGPRVATADDPKLVVARGAARWAGRPDAAPTAPVVTAPSWEASAAAPAVASEPAWEAAQPAWEEPAPATTWLPPADDLYRPPTWSPEQPAAGPTSWSTPYPTPAPAPEPTPEPHASDWPSPQATAADAQPHTAGAHPHQQHAHQQHAHQQHAAQQHAGQAAGAEITIMALDLPRGGGRLWLTSTRLVRTDPKGAVDLEVHLHDISYVVTYGIGAVQVTRRSGEVVRVTVGARQMMRWRTAIQQAMATAG